MNHQQLQQELRRVGTSYRWLLLHSGLAALWLALALLGLSFLAWTRGGAQWAVITAAVTAVALLVVLPVVLTGIRLVRNPLWVARRIERRFPELDARLLAALEQQPDQPSGELGYLQQAVAAEALDHAREHRWEQTVGLGRLRTARWVQRGMLVLLVAVVTAVIAHMNDRVQSGEHWASVPKADEAGIYQISVEPEDAEVERGTGLLVLARFGERLPPEARLIYRGADGQVRQATMSKSLDDPLYAARISSIKEPLTYAVQYGDEQTRWYEVSVFDYPDLKQADADLKFPQYTGLEPKRVEDTRSVTAVEGTQATFTFRLNKPVAQARLVEAARGGKEANAEANDVSQKSLSLTPEPDQPGVYMLSLDLKQSQRFRLHLVDEQGRPNKEPPELVVNVTQNQPPELTLEWPGRDVDVSPLEELSVKAQVWDDFGVRRVGVNYALAGRAPQEAVLGEEVAAKEKRAVSQLVSLEKMSAAPDELLSYYFWAEDIGPDGQVRRTSGDMFFAEVRDFEQIFRQGEQPAGGQQQQQGGAGARQAEELAELQKQIIAATWKVLRREKAAELSAEFVPDVDLIIGSQSTAREQAEALGEQLTDARSRQHLENVLKHMDEATAQLSTAGTGPSVDAMPPALAAEQQAYQELLKLRAREVEVIRGSQQQGASGSSASARRQQQLNQLELDQEENRYETQNTAAPQEENPAQRETRQVLNRLRELAQRQEDLNRQMRELQAALEQAQDEARKEEIRRQLARLRDQQQQQLRDTDELRDRMDQPENQQQMADARQQLEQTREEVRRASEALEKEMVADASAAGARAGEQLDKLREDFRKATAGQFNEAMDQMRQNARELDKDQQAVSQRLTELDQAERPALRDSDDRQQVAQDLQQQKEKLEGLLENMRQTIEEAESAEPLLSKQLYETVRETRQQQVDEALSASSELLDRGFLDEAREAEGEAARGISRLREGVERAAESVLGDEAEELRRARSELDALAQELEREINRNAPATDPSTRPSDDNARQARNSPTTRGAANEGERAQASAERSSRQGESAGDQEGEREGASPQQGEPESRLARAGAEAGEREGASRSGRERGQRSGERAGGESGEGERREGEGREPGEREGEGREPGVREGEGREAGSRPGEGPAGESERAEGQGRDGEGREGQRQQGEGQQGENQQGEGQQGEAAQANGSGRGSARGEQSEGESGGRSGSTDSGESGEEADAEEGEPSDQPGSQPGNQRGRPGGLRQAGGGGGPGGETAAADLRRFLDNSAEPGGPEARGPITGDGFREWSDRLRDVEEMVGDPRLREEAARIRDRAREMRTNLKRHSKEPDWDLVREFVGRPLVELRDAVAQELLRRDSSEALVPIDREPVPPEFAEQVRKYYERLGSGE